MRIGKILVQIFGGMSLIALVWFCAHMVFPGRMDDWDVSVAHNGVGTVFVAFICISFLCSFFHFGARFILAYIVAFIIILVAVWWETGGFPSFHEYQHGYAKAGMLVLLPFGNVLNLLWLRHPEFRLAQA